MTSPLSTALADITFFEHEGPPGRTVTVNARGEPRG